MDGQVTIETIADLAQRAGEQGNPLLENALLLIVLGKQLPYWKRQLLTAAGSMILQCCAADKVINGSGA
jgi:hypothetical protein